MEARLGPETTLQCLLRGCQESQSEHLSCHPWRLPETHARHSFRDPGAQRTQEEGENTALSWEEPWGLTDATPLVAQMEKLRKETPLSHGAGQGEQPNSGGAP